MQPTLLQQFCGLEPVALPQPCSLKFSVLVQCLVPTKAAGAGAGATSKMLATASTAALQPRRCCTNKLSLYQCPLLRWGVSAGRHTPVAKGTQMRARVNAGGPRYGKVAVRNRKLEVRSCHWSGKVFFCTSEAAPGVFRTDSQT